MNSMGSPTKQHSPLVPALVERSTSLCADKHLFRQVMGSRISKKDMLHGTEEMFNAEAAVLKAAAEGWNIDRLSGSTMQVRVYDHGCIDRLSGSTTQVRVYDKGSYSDSDMSCSCEYNISASAQVGKSAPQSAFDTVMAAFFRRKAAYSIIIKDLSTGARVQSFH